MTIQCVISYFENGDMGYLLASDSRVSTKRGDCINDDYLGEKAFFGDNFIGLFRGSIHSKKNEDVEKCYLNYMSLLDDVFCDIKEDADYSNVPLFKKAIFYEVFIAKKEEDKLQLFSISSLGDNGHKAYKLHELSDKTEELSKVWFSGFTSNVFTFKPKFIFNLEEATEVAATLLSADVHFCKDRNYDPGPTHLYVVSSKQIGRIGVI